MNLRELLLWGLVGWTAIGALGIAASLVRRERAKAMRGFAWISGVWVVYLGILVAVSLRQPQRVLAVGDEQCFGDMCFAVTRVEEVPGFPVRDKSGLIRVSVRVRNKGRSTQNERRIRAYLIDSNGRQWKESAGVSGVQLTSKVVGGESVMSEPVFKVAANATALDLVFTRGWSQPGTLIIGDSDSWLHRRTIVRLGR
jgi:hypothetical protein